LDPFYEHLCTLLAPHCTSTPCKMCCGRSAGCAQWTNQ